MNTEFGISSRRERTSAAHRWTLARNVSRRFSLAWNRNIAVTMTTKRGRRRVPMKDQISEDGAS